MAKIKSNRDVVMSLQHNTRDRMPPNAAPEKTAQNWYQGGRTLEALARYDGLLPEDPRANAVRAVEIVMTASPDFSGDWQRYLGACDEWAKNLFGEENLLHVSHHFDESTPHTHIMFVPLKDGKLNASHFIGGSRDRMAELQEDFFQKAGLPFALERGQSKSETKARHTPHTLAGKAAELDVRESDIEGKAARLGEREVKLAQVGDDFKQLMGMKPADVRELKTLAGNWDKATPAALRVIAKDVEQSGAATVGEYRQAQEARRKREQQQRGNNFSR